MKKSTRRIGSILALSGVLLCGSVALAQDDGANDNSSNRTSYTTRTDTDTDNDDTDYGWLGLLGLAGLAGLLKKPERQVIHQTDVVTPSHPTTPNPPNSSNR